MSAPLLLALALSLLGCADLEEGGVDAQTLCAGLLTSSLDDCGSLGSPCVTVTCVDAINEELCGREELEQALVSEAVLQEQAAACDARLGAQWREWDCSRGDQLVACEEIQ